MTYDPAKDPHKGTLLNFGTRSALVAPSDADDFASYPKAIQTLTAGDLKVLPLENADADAIQFIGVPAGWSPSFRVRRVFLTGTTATVCTIVGP